MKYMLASLILLIAGCTILPAKQIQDEYVDLILKSGPHDHRVRIIEGSIQYHPANSLNPCSFYTYVPPGLKTQSNVKLVVIPRSSDRDEEKTKKFFSSFLKYFEKHRVVGLIVNMKLGEKLTKSTMKNGDSRNYRADIHLYDSVFNQFLPMLKENELVPSEKILLYGYSGAGSFAYKFALFFPQRVEAVFFGGASATPLPFSSLNGKTINYPVGVNDFISYIPEPFDLQAFMSIRFFEVRGGIDANQIINRDYYSDSEIQFFESTFSSIPNIREQKIVDLYVENGLDFHYYEYAGWDHAISDQILLPDAFSFLVNGEMIVR